MLCRRGEVRRCEAGREFSISFHFIFTELKRGDAEPILQMHNALNANLRHVIEIEQHVCNNS